MCLILLSLSEMSGKVAGHPSDKRKLNKTMNIVAKVVAQGETISVPSQKSENGQTSKCSITLQAFGGRYEDTFVATMLGNAAQCRFYKDDLVMVALRFTTREYNGQVYQDIVVNDICKVK